MTGPHGDSYPPEPDRALIAEVERQLAAWPIEERYGQWRDSDVWRGMTSAEGDEITAMQDRLYAARSRRRPPRKEPTEGEDHE